jgi:hypothetical protein
MSAGPPDDVDERAPRDDLGQPVLGRVLDVEAGVLEHLRRPLGLGLGHEEVGVVIGLRRTAHPGGVAAAQGERDPGLLERHGRPLQQVANFVALGWLHAGLATRPDRCHAHRW